VAGWDTLRGVSFQHAGAIAAALDLVAAADGVTLQIEGDADIIDLLLASQTQRRAIQARSRVEPGTWPPSELAEPVGAWVASSPDQSETFEFVSDAPLSRDSGLKLVPAIERVIAGEAGQDDVELLEKLELPVEPALLGRVSFKTRAGTTTQLLTNAVMRVATLLQTSPTDAEDAVARIFQLIAVTGGLADATKRTLTRADVAEELGVDLEAIDAGDAWDAALRDAYTAGAMNAEDDPLMPAEPPITNSGVELDLRIAREGESAMSFGPGPTAQHLQPEEMIGLLGPAGSGKSTTLRLLNRRSLRDGGLPFLLSAASYTEGELLPRVDRLISRRSGRRVRPGVSETALRSSGAWLLVDGLTGLADSGRQAVLHDVRRLRERMPELMVAAVDRDAALLRRLALTIYHLEGLNRDQARRLAESIVGQEQAEQALRDIEARLTDAPSNPLLLTMALRLWHDSGAPTTRMELYAAAVQVLRERSDASLSDGVLELMTRAALRLVEDGLYEADRYWWLVALREAMEAVSAEGVFELDVSTGEAAVEAGQAIGLLRTSAEGSALGFLHESFRDFLVARALERDASRIPSTVGPSWEPSLQMLAEAAGLTPPLTATALTSIPLAGLVAPLDRDPAGDRASEAPQLVRDLLVRHIGPWPEGLDAEHLSVSVAYTPQYRYVVLGAADEPVAELVDADRIADIAPSAPYQFALPPTVGPLALAFCVWRELISLTTSAIAIGGPRVLPENDEEIVTLVADDFRQRKEALAHYASELFPTFAERLVGEIGWHGLTARLLPPVATDMGPGYLTSSRWLAYDTRTSAVDVAVAGEGEGDDLPDRDEIDGYLQTTPEGSALKALVNELERIAPRVDWRRG